MKIHEAGGNVIMCQLLTARAAVYCHYVTLVQLLLHNLDCVVVVIAVILQHYKCFITITLHIFTKRGRVRAHFTK